MPDFVDKLIEKLNASDKDVIKSSIIEDLGSTLDPRALRALIQALNDTDALVRWHAIKGIARFRAAAIQPLFNALESPDKFTRRNVIQALGEIANDAVIEKFVKMLMFDETEQIVLIEIINCLGRIREPRAVDPLITVLKTDDWETKWRAVHALGRIADPKSIQPLLEQLEHPDKDIRWATATAIENIKNINHPEGEQMAVEPEALAAAAGAPPRRGYSSIKLTTTEDDATVIIAIGGELMASNIDMFSGFVDGALSGKEKSLRLDLSECAFVDSFALGRLNIIRKRLKARGRRFSMTGLTPNVRRVFDATRLDEVFEIE